MTDDTEESMAENSQENEQLHYVSNYPESWNYCPDCGNKLEKEDFVVGSVPGPDGEPVPTKYNTTTLCPEHGVIVQI